MHALPARPSRHMKEAKTTFESIGDRLGAAQCTQSLGNSMSMQTDYDGATEAMTEAKTTFESIGDRQSVARCTELLAEVAQRQNE